MKKLILIIALCVGSLNAQSASISGRVMNQTTGRTVSAEWIALVKPGQGMQTLQQIANASEYDFKDVPVQTEVPYLIRTSFQGVVYTQPMMINEARVYKVDAAVYDVTREWRSITVKVPHMIVARNGDHLEIEQTYEVQNAGAKTYVTDDPAKPTFLFGLPEGVTITGISTRFGNSMPLPANPIRDAGQAGIFLPIRPGTTQIQIQFQAHYENALLQWTQKQFYPIPEFRLFVTPKDIQVVADGFTQAHDDRLEQNNFAVFFRSDVKDRLRFQLSGGSPRVLSEEASGEDTIVAAPGEIQKAIWVILPTLAGILMFALYGALSRSPSDDSAKLARSIAELDETHKQQPEDPAYLEKRLAMKKELSDHLRRIKSEA